MGKDLINKGKEKAFTVTSQQQLRGKRINIQILKYHWCLVDITPCLWTPMGNEVLFVALDNPKGEQTKNSIFKENISLFNTV